MRRLETDGTLVTKWFSDYYLKLKDENSKATVTIRVLIDKLINLIVENLGVRSDMREWYFAFFRSLLICMLVSNPTVS